MITWKRLMTPSDWSQGLPADERRRGEESLRESEERYRVMAETRLLLASIVESSDDAIISENSMVGSQVGIRAPK